MTAQLAGRYRLLIRAYPRWYRAARGTEMITTLMDAATPDRRRPAWRDAADLVLGGLRCRLRPPRPLGYRLAALACAFGIALAVLALAGPLLVAGSPGQRTMAAATAVAVPGRPLLASADGRGCAWCPDWDNGPLRAGRFAVAGYPTDPDSVRGLATASRQRLMAAGWDVTGVTEDENAVVFRASRDGTGLSFTGDMWSADPNGVTVRLVLTRSLGPQRGSLLALTVGAGALVGWLGAVWGLQRFRRHRQGIQAAIAVTGALAVSGVLMVGGQAVMATAAAVAFTGWSANYLLLPSVLLWTVLAIPATLAVLTAAALVLAALPLRVRPERQPAGAVTE